MYYKGRNYTWEVKQRQQIPIELSLFVMRSFIFVKMLKQHLLCIKAGLVSSNSSGFLKELNLNNSVSSLTRWVISWKVAPVLGVEQVQAV